MCNKGIYKNILIMKYLIDIYKVATLIQVVHFSSDGKNYKPHDKPSVHITTE